MIRALVGTTLAVLLIYVLVSLVVLFAFVVSGEGWRWGFSFGVTAIVTPCAMAVCGILFLGVLAWEKIAERWFR